MKLYVSHISALHFWRTWTGDCHVQDERSRKQMLTGCCRSAKDDDGLRPPAYLFGEGKTHVIVPDGKYRVNHRDFIYHVCSAKIPERSLIELSDRVLISSPELCFVQMAHILSVPGLVVLGMELCGTYRLRPGEPAEAGHSPLTTPAKLASLVERCQGIKGYRKASRALRWVLAGSASPMEARSYVCLCFPARMRGYALPLPKPNGEMRLNRHQQLLADRATSYGDLYWPEQEVDVEYFGKDWHTGRERMTSDAKRSNALESRGTKAYTLTDEIYESMEGFDAFAREVARALGVRVRDRNGDMALESWELKHELAEQEALTFPPAERKDPEEGEGGGGSGENAGGDGPPWSPKVFGAKASANVSGSGQAGGPPQDWVC